MEVEIEGVAGKEALRGHLSMPGGEEPGRLGVVDAGGVCREVALLRDDIESAEEPEALVGDERHHVTLALERPELQRERGPQGMPGGDHPRARPRRGPRQAVHAQTDQVGHEQKQPSAPRGEAAPRLQDKLADVGDRLDRRPEVRGPLLVETPG